MEQSRGANTASDHVFPTVRPLLERDRASLSQEQVWGNHDFGIHDLHSGRRGLSPDPLGC